MTKRISCTKLSKTLEGVNIELPPGQLRKSCEAYGRNVECYVRCETPERRTEVERYLEGQGCKVNRSYSPGSSTTAVAVTYFKAWHWGE